MNKKRRKNWIYNIAIVFFLGIMVFSLWNLVPLLMQEHADNETQKEMEQMVEKVEEETQIVRLDLCAGYRHQLSDRTGKRQ